MSKIDINPSKIPNTDTINTGYWIINNYGSNVNFSNIESIQFSNFIELENLSASGIEMFVRDRNSSKSDNWILKSKANFINPLEKSITLSTAMIAISEVTR